MVCVWYPHGYLSSWFGGFNINARTRVIEGREITILLVPAKNVSRIGEIAATRSYTDKLSAYFKDWKLKIPIFYANFTICDTIDSQTEKSYDRLLVRLIIWISSRLLSRACPYKPPFARPPSGPLDKPVRNLDPAMASGLENLSYLAEGKPTLRYVVYRLQA